MYKGYQLKINRNNFCENDFSRLYNLGEGSLSKHKIEIKKVIDSFSLVDGSLDGSKMQANWFPQIKADIFISHSHMDQQLAIVLAGWLKETFSLTAFIDSCVWGYSDELLKKIDNTYCRNNNEKTYDYQKRNYSTSHVHMMLSVALAQMIDSTECLFFLNTPNSISPESIISQTESPWIYAEIAMTQLIRKKELDNYRVKLLNESQETFSTGGRILRIKYDLPTDHLADIDVDNLTDWTKNWVNLGTQSKICPQYPANSSIHALDKLYELIKK